MVHVVVPPLSPVRHYRSSTRQQLAQQFTDRSTGLRAERKLLQLALGDAGQQPLRRDDAATRFPPDTKSTHSFSSTAATGYKPSRDGLR